MKKIYIVIVAGIIIISMQIYLMSSKRNEYSKAIQNLEMIKENVEDSRNENIENNIDVEKINIVEEIEQTNSELEDKNDKAFDKNGNNSTIIQEKKQVIESKEDKDEKKDGYENESIIKNVEQEEADRKLSQQRNSLIAAARNGDEEAMEILTMEDIDMYTMISRRIQHEDVYTIVDSYFMPYGIECDQYNLMGEITECNTTVNSVTGEKLYQLGIVSNDIPLDICINEKDLLGIPEVGRRFKGVIWLQGMINF